MIIIISLAIMLVIAIFIFVQQPMFGKFPSGERLERIEKSPNYVNGSFKNLHPTPVMVEGVNPVKLFFNFFFSKKSNKEPIDEIPSTKIDLYKLDRNKDIVIWFGHSSYFIQIDGKRILVDPVLRASASPISFFVKAFKGTTKYTPDDIPDIDYLFITHDHWDHLDYETVTKIKSKVKKVFCGLGVGEDLEYWGYSKNQIVEKDWNEEINIDNGFTIYTVPARHFSGRSYKRNKTLWTSYILLTPTMKIFLDCDGGFDTHYAEIGKRFGAFNLAILENGQYNDNWKYIHKKPEEVLQVAKDLNAKMILPIHSSKFVLSIHSWDEPLKRISELCKNVDLKLLTPIIGEEVRLKDSSQKFTEWWKNIK